MDDRTALSELLRPTLQDSGAPVALYSMQAFMLCAFFGGPFAALGFWGWNSQRIGRLQRELPWILVFSVLALAVIAAAHTWFPPEQGRFTSSADRIATRLYALAIVGFAWLRVRERYRAMQVAGLQSPNGTILAIACGLVGFALYLLAVRGVHAWWAP